MVSKWSDSLTESISYCYSNMQTYEHVHTAKINLL